jgi:hypothetical protein
MYLLILAWCHQHDVTSPGPVAIVVGVAFIGLGGVNFTFLMVSPNLISNFLVLPNQTPYSELELPYS